MRYCKILIGLLFLWLPTSFASAQSCEQGAISTEMAVILQQASTELSKEKNPDKAIRTAETAWDDRLSCFEEGELRKLLAVIEMERGRHSSAAFHLEWVLRSGYTSSSERLNMLLIVANLNYTENQTGVALKYFNDWLQAGGEPNLMQKKVLASINVDQSNYFEAAAWFGRIRNEHPEFSDPKVDNIEVYVLGETAQYEKQITLLELLIRRDPDNATLKTKLQIAREDLVWQKNRDAERAREAELARIEKAQQQKRQLQSRQTVRQSKPRSCAPEYNRCVSSINRDLSGCVDRCGQAGYPGCEQDCQEYAQQDLPICESQYGSCKGPSATALADMGYGSSSRQSDRNWKRGEDFKDMFSKNGCPGVRLDGKCVCQRCAAEFPWNSLEYEMYSACAAKFDRTLSRGYGECAAE